MSAAIRNLTGLLAPLSAEEFVARHWEKLPVFIPGASDKFHGFFDAEDFWRALGETRTGYGQRRVYVKAGHRLADGSHRELPITSGQVPQALAAGLTVQAEWLDSVNERLHQLQESVRAELGIAAEMDAGCFISPDKSGYGVHFDATGMFTLQIEGQKRWRYAPAPTVAWPRQNFVPTREDLVRGTHGLREDALVDQLLSPGDVLYLPPGTWHRPEAIGQSLHLSLTVRASSPLQLFSSLLEEKLAQSPDWRHLPSAPLGSFAAAEDGLAMRLRELQRAVAELQPEEAARAFAARVRRDPLPGPRAGLEREASLAVAEEPPFRYAYEPGGAVVLLLGASVVGTLPAGARPFVERLFAAKQFTAAEAARWDSETEWADVQALLEQLTSVGCLRRIR